MTRLRLWLARLLCPRGWWICQLGDQMTVEDNTFVAVKFHDTVEVGRLAAYMPDEPWGVVSMEPDDDRA